MNGSSCAKAKEVLKCFSGIKPTEFKLITPRVSTCLTCENTEQHLQETHHPESEYNEETL